MNKIKSLVLILFFFGLASCAKQAPTNYLSINVPHGLTVTEVQTVLIKAANDHGWTVNLTGPNTMSASNNSLSESAAVNISYDATSYSILYKYSAHANNFKGTVTSGYNEVVAKFQAQIQDEFKEYVASKNKK